LLTHGGLKGALQELTALEIAWLICADVGGPQRPVGNDLVQALYDRVKCVSNLLESCRAQPALMSLLTGLLGDTLNLRKCILPGLKDFGAEGRIQRLDVFGKRLSISQPVGAPLLNVAGNRPLLIRRVVLDQREDLPTCSSQYFKR
jgi:hypothetical protein